MLSASTRNEGHSLDDAFDEHPFIYAKLVPAARTLLLVDTGCGGRTRAPSRPEFPRLRDFLERAPVADNGGRPLNAGGALRYVVVLTPCHYDHIRTSVRPDSVAKCVY